MRAMVVGRQYGRLVQWLGGKIIRLFIFLTSKVLERFVQSRKQLLVYDSPVYQVISK